MEFAFPIVRWILKGWFFASAIAFLYLFWIDIFVHRWFILLWSFFSAGLGAYVAPAIRVKPDGLGVKYLWRWRSIPWNRILAVQKTVLGAQIMTAEPGWMYRVVGYQYPMPQVPELVAVVRAAMRRRSDRNR